MNLSTNNNQNDVKKKKTLGMIKSIILIIVVILVATIGLISYMSVQKSNALKIRINGKNYDQLASTDIFVISENDVKVKLKGIAPYLGNYTFKNGLYARESQYTEDKTKCYLENEYEAVSFNMNSKTIEKVVKNDSTNRVASSYSNENLKFEQFDISEPVTMINNELYVNFTGISVGLNSLISYDRENNLIKIETVEYLSQYYANKITGAFIYGDEVPYNYKKALKYGFAVIRDEAR